VSQPRRDDPAAALNQVLSEVIDAVLDVQQAHRRVPETHALHAVLDQLSPACRRALPGSARRRCPAGVTFLTHGQLTSGACGEGLIMRIGAASSARNMIRG
jgi:hypothetical protein